LKNERADTVEGCQSFGLSKNRLSLISNCSYLCAINVPFDMHTMKDFFNSRVLAFSLCAIMACVLHSCNRGTDTPDGILSKDEMAKVLTEFYLKESKINSLHVTHDSALVLFQYFKQKYGEENDIADSTLETSYQYYLARPAALGEVYDRIIDSLTLREQRDVVTPPVVVQ
jgi:Domain of unknown function (DUF4296)